MAKNKGSLDVKRMEEILLGDWRPIANPADLFMEEAMLFALERLDATRYNLNETLRKIAGTEYVDIRLGLAVPLITVLEESGELPLSDAMKLFQESIYGAAPWLPAHPKRYYSRGIWLSTMFTKIVDHLSRAGVARVKGSRLVFEGLDRIGVVSRFYGYTPDNHFKYISIERALAMSVTHLAGAAGIDPDFVPEAVRSRTGYEIRNWSRKRLSIEEAHGPKGTGYLVIDTRGALWIRSPNRVEKRLDAPQLSEGARRALEILSDVGILPDTAVVAMFGHGVMRELMVLSSVATTGIVVRYSRAFASGYRVRALKLFEPRLDIERVIPLMETLFRPILVPEMIGELKKAVVEVATDLLKGGRARPSTSFGRYVAEVLASIGVATREGDGYVLNEELRGFLKSLLLLVKGV